MGALLSINNLSKEFVDSGRRVKALQNINLVINEGETLGIVGESGCGKSTLGNIIVKLLEPTSGSVEFDDSDITSIKGKQLKAFRRQVQIVFQDPYSSINPTKTIGWLIREPLVIHGIGTKEEQEEAVDKILVSVGLDISYKNKYPRQLSGGQRQRVAIAIALICKPKFVVADEPVSALDVSVQAQILNLMKDLQKEFGLTYLFISHDLGVISYLSDRIGVMYLGNLVELGTADEISQSPLHPYTQALFSAVMKLDDTEGKRIILSGDIPSPANPPQGCPFHTRCVKCFELCTKQKPDLKPAQDGRLVACHLH